MLQTGIFVRCERCGTTEFFADKNGRRNAADADYNSSKWGRLNNRDLCPVCLDAYYDWCRKFFDDFCDK